MTQCNTKKVRCKTTSCFEGQISRFGKRCLNRFSYLCTCLQMGKKSYHLATSIFAFFPLIFSLFIFFKTSFILVLLMAT